MAKKILVIEDEPSILEMLRMYLTRAGYEVAVCDNGREAVDIALAEKPDLILLDVMLPGMDGITLAQEFYSDAELGSIPIIVASALQESRSSFSNFPQVRDFAAKPFNLAALTEKIKNIIGQ